MMKPITSTFNKSVLRGLRKGTSLPLSSFRRFQTTHVSQKSEPLKNVSSKDEEPVSDIERRVNDTKVSSKAKTQRKQINRKLKSITDQIKVVVDDPQSDQKASISILEEGISYLREIQTSEAISEESLYSVFQPIVLKIVKKVGGNPSSSSSLDDLLDVLVQYKLAHKLHFLITASSNLANERNRNTAFEKVLETWLKFLEYQKTSDNALISNFYGFMRQQNVFFFQDSLSNLAFYAYVNSCLAHNAAYNLNDALKLLQSKDVPELFQIRRTFTGLGLQGAVKEEFNTFERQFEKVSLEQLDPNGSLVIKKINNAVAHSDVGRLNKLYDQIKLSSSNSRAPITEATLVKLMNAFYECKLYTDVFGVFQDLVSSGVSKPSTVSWEYVLRAMGNPSYISGLSSSEKSKNMNNIERTIETMIENDNEITPKTLSVIIAAFANMNKFDKVDEYLRKFSVDGDGKLPVIFASKNNILVGLTLNKKIKEAELKLKEFMEDGSGFIPSTTAMNTFLNYYAKTKNYKAVEGITNFMKQAGIPEEIGTYTIVTDIFFKMHREKGLSPNIEQLLAGFTSEGNITFNEFALSALVDGLVKDGTNIEAARTLFDYVTKKFKPSPQLITSMLQGELDHGSLENAQKLFKYYVSSVRNDARIWNMMINSFLRKDENLALEYFSMFQNQKGPGPKAEANFYTYYFLLSHFIKRGNKKNVQLVLDELARRPINNLGSEVPKLLRNLSKSYQIDEELLKRL